MHLILITLENRTIRHMRWFCDPGAAIDALEKIAASVDTTRTRTALWSSEGVLAKASEFTGKKGCALADCRGRMLARILASRPVVYLIANPHHPLGFMVASPDDPIGFTAPEAALSELGQMRKDAHAPLRLYRAEPVTGPITTRPELDRFNEDSLIDDFDHKLIKEHLY